MALALPTQGASRFIPIVTRPNQIYYGIIRRPNQTYYVAGAAGRGVDGARGGLPSHETLLRLAPARPRYVFGPQWLQFRPLLT